MRTVRANGLYAMPVNEREAESGGDFKADSSFESAPPSFLKFARDKWGRLGVERLH